MDTPNCRVQKNGTARTDINRWLVEGSLRSRFKMSQAVFAAFLNTSVSTVQKWEIGEKTPTG